LKGDAPPSGVVFEVVQGQRDALDWALPMINEQITRLRERFPNLPIAVVSHGNEQFALQQEAADEKRELHRTVQDLVRNEDVPVHVCGTYASLFNIGAESFPDYVDFAPSGPAQISAYLELGYERLVIEPSQ
jgi:intracellular sulfur oxidation DsrE/DsrF family protein